METRGNKRQRGKKVLAAVLATIMLLASAITVMAAETTTITGETKDGEILNLMNISGVLGRPEEDFKATGGRQFPTYICSSDFAVEFTEACKINFCRVIGLEWREAKQDPNTMTFIEEGYNDAKSYKPNGNKFTNPDDGTKVFQIIASVVNDKNVTQLKDTQEGVIFLVIDDTYVATTEETTEPVAEQTEVTSETITAKYTDSTIMINGKAVEFEAYNINNNNYFKLRDLAMALNGTEAQFSVEWYPEANEIAISSFSGYTPVGGELVAGDGTDKVAYASSQIVNAPYDGGMPGWVGYNISENNYFKLRDIGAFFDFEVDWDGENNCVIVDTTKPYTAD